MLASTTIPPAREAIDAPCQEPVAEGVLPSSSPSSGPVDLADLIAGIKQQLATPGVHLSKRLGIADLLR